MADAAVADPYANLAAESPAPPPPTAPVPWQSGQGTLPPLNLPAVPLPPGTAPGATAVPGGGGSGVGVVVLPAPGTGPAPAAAPPAVIDVPTGPVAPTPPISPPSPDVNATLQRLRQQQAGTGQPQATPGPGAAAVPTGRDLLAGGGTGGTAQPQTQPAITPTGAGAAPYDPYANLPPAPAPAADPYANVPSGPDTPTGAAPETQEQMLARLPGQSLTQTPWYQPIAENVKGALASVQHGASLGLDELVDPIWPALMDHISTGKPFTQAYTEQQQMMSNPRTEFEREHPASATALSVAGGIPATVMAGPLFGEAAPGASVLSRVGTAARNVAASTALGAGTGFTMTDGDIHRRLQGAESGALFGAAAVPLGAAATSVGTGLLRAATPGRQIPGIVGQAVHEAVGGVPGTVTAPIPGVKLNLAQATGSPGAASAMDTLNALNVPARDTERAEQNQAMQGALFGTVKSGERGFGYKGSVARGSRTPSRIAGRGSRMASTNVQTAAKIIDTEEKRLWNTPAMKRPISTYEAKARALAVVRAIYHDEPGLSPGVEHAVVKKALGLLTRFPDKAPVNQINSVTSALRTLARDPEADGQARQVATRLANAIQDGMGASPEIAGRAPLTGSSVGAGPAVPPVAAPKPGQRITASQVQARDKVGHNEAVRRAEAENAMAKLAEKPPPRPESLIAFLTRHGGVRPDADLEARGLGDYHHQGGGRLLDKNGMSLNQARELLAGEGYIPFDVTDDEVRDAMHDDYNAWKDRSGNRVYRSTDALEAEYWRQMDEHADRMAAQHEASRAAVAHVEEQSGMHLSPVEREHAAQMLSDDPSMHPEEAVKQAADAGDEAILQNNATRYAFGAPGVPHGAGVAPLPDVQELANGVAPDPEISRDYKAARAFTEREAQVLGHASFDNILRRNSRGNETLTPETAMGKFFDFAHGTERPGSIRNVTDFLNDIRQSWLKLSQAERGKLYQPSQIGPVMAQLQDGTRNYIFGQMLDAMTRKAEDMHGERLLDYANAGAWIDDNREMLQRTGLFTSDQLDLLDRFRETTRMIQRGNTLGRVEGSPTFTRAMNASRFVDLFTGSLAGRLMGAGAGAVMGTFLTRWLGEAAIGAMIGAEMGGAGSGTKLIQALYSVPRAKLLAALDEAWRNPLIARDLAMKVNTAGTTRPSAATRQWVRALISIEPPAQMARRTSEVAPAQPQPAMAQ